MLEVNHLIGFGANSTTLVPVTAFSDTLTTDSGGSDGGFSFRVALGTLTAGGTQIRVTFEGAVSQPFVVDNASIGIRSGATDDTTATPVELLFSGVSGFSLSAGGTTTSDWATLTTSAGDTVLVIMDITTTTSYTRYSSGGTSYYKAATNSYNTQTVTGFSSTARNSCVPLIEVQ